MKALITAIALVASTVPAIASARGYDDAIDQRQQQLEHRIQQGWRSGELTRPEYVRLQREMRDITRNERAFAADGFLSRREREHLLTRLDIVSRDVYRQKHDVERRGGFYNGDHRADRRY